MKKQYRLATFALSACLLMACGARETNAPENNEAEKQTENISNIDTKIDEAEDLRSSQRVRIPGNTHCTERNRNRVHRNIGISPGRNCGAALFPGNPFRDGITICFRNVRREYQNLRKGMEHEV